MGRNMECLSSQTRWGIKQHQILKCMHDFDRLNGRTLSLWMLTIPVITGDCCEKVAFLHECMYMWQFHFGVRNGGYFDFWRFIVAGYIVNHCFCFRHFYFQTDVFDFSINLHGGTCRYTQEEGQTRQEKTKQFESTRKLFTRAAKSFAILHYLDYKEAFSCRCPVRWIEVRKILLCFNRY